MISQNWKFLSFFSRKQMARAPSEYFESIGSPTKEELYRWSTTVDCDHMLPMEDFDLMVSLDISEAIEFLEDPAVINKHFYLNYICLRVGEMARASNYKEFHKFYTKYKNHPSVHVRKVAEAVNASKQKKFQYQYWCSGGLAGEILATNPFSHPRVSEWDQ